MKGEEGLKLSHLLAMNEGQLNLMQLLKDLPL
jgi:hypothetical protein